MSSMKEKDDFSALFQSLGEAKMPVKEGFWEDLEKDLSAITATPVEEVTAKHAVIRPVWRRWMAAASVLLVLSLGSVAFWYLNSQEQDIQQAFSEVSAKLATSPESNQPETDTPNIYNKVSEPMAATL